MKGFPLISCFVSVVLYISLICVESQDFCQSYEKNNYSAIVFSQSEDTIMLIVGRHFWRLRENDTELRFDRQNFEASNASEQWTETYDFAHPVYDLGDDKYRGIALIKDLHSPIDAQNQFFGAFNNNFYRIDGNYFKHINSENKYMEMLSDTLFVNYAFTIYSEKLNVEILQYQESNTKSLESQYRQVLSNYSTKLIQDVNIPVISPLIEKLSELEPNISVFGIHFNSKNESILFFKRENDIKYCAVEQCIRNEYNVLISCTKTIQTFVSKVWILIVITVVVIAVILGIPVIVIYFMRERSRETYTTSIDQSQSIENLRSSGSAKSTSTEEQSLKTNELGNQKTKAKEVKKVCPKEIPKATKLIKPKIATKPKKSPKG